MAHVVVLGAGLGGVPMALEARRALRRTDRVTVVSAQPTFDFTPSNPWVAVGWRRPDQIRVDLAPMFARRRIDFVSGRASAVRPAENRIELEDGGVVSYDHLVVATGPELAFDEIDGLGPHGGHTQSVCTTAHAALASEAWERFCRDPGPIVVGAVQGASCFGPAYEFAFIMDADLRRRRLRDRVPMTFVTSEPYIGHLGLDGVGDTRGLLESALRDKHIKWITSARVRGVEAERMHVEELADDGSVRRTHELPFRHAMMLPAFRGVKPLQGVEGLVNPRGFVVIDRQQRNPVWKNVYAVGVCVAIPPIGPTPVPVGVPKTGFMIESMVRAATHNIRADIDGRPAQHVATWNAVCLADFGDNGVAFVAMPQIPPRNVNWSSQGRWVHLGKVAFEKYFLRKIRKGVSEPFYERAVLDMLGIARVEDRHASA